MTLALMVSTAQAVPTTFDFTATVTDYSTDLSTDPFAGTIGVGNSISGYYTFDTAAPDSNPGTGFGNYYWPGGAFTVHAEIGSHTFDYHTGLQIIVEDDCGYGSIDPTTGCGPVNKIDLYQVHGIEHESTDITNQFLMFLVDDNLNALDNDSLLLTPPLLSAFTRTDGTIVSMEDSTYGGIYRYWIDYDLTSLTMRSVPEPATFLLLGAGLVGLGFTRRKNT
jgi:hypothetical protein